MQSRLREAGSRKRRLVADVDRIGDARIDGLDHPFVSAYGCACRSSVRQPVSPTKACCVRRNGFNENDEASRTANRTDDRRRTWITRTRFHSPAIRFLQANRDCTLDALDSSLAELPSAELSAMVRNALHVLRTSTCVVKRLGTAIRAVLQRIPVFPGL